MLYLQYLVLLKRMLFKENAKPIRKYNRLYSRDPHLHIARTLLHWISTPSFPPLHFARTFEYWGDNERWVSRHWDVYNSEKGRWEYQVSYCGFILVICGHFNRILKERFKILSGYSKIEQARVTCRISMLATGYEAPYIDSWQYCKN